MWPSAVALSRWLVSNPLEVQDKDILELGAGCGLVGLVAARLKVKLRKEIDRETSHVKLTDFNELVLKNIDQNIFLNGLEGAAKGAGLDFYIQDAELDGWLDSNGTKRDQVDLILASDIICQPDDAFAAARSICYTLRSGGKAIIVCADSKHRFGVERFEEACLELGLKVSRTDVKDLYEGRLLCSELEKTSGYVEGMALTMHTVVKVIQ
jgi:predicted nicotinamide N-methyase